MEESETEDDLRKEIWRLIPKKMAPTLRVATLLLLRLTHPPK